MVSLYFGLPGCGKTTLLTKLALKYSKGKRYKNVYTNIHINVPNTIYVDNDEIGVYNIVDGVLLIDEATLFADSREYKKFPKHLVKFFLMHRHYNVDIILMTQQWDSVDKKIRVITDRVYYVYKPFPLGIFMTRYYRIPYGIIIPDPKKDDSQKLGEIVQGYCKPPLIKRMFGGYVIRPLYYKYFDSWEREELPTLPDMEKRTV